MPEFFELAIKHLNEYSDLQSHKQQETYKVQSKAIKATEDELRGLQRMLYTGRCSETFFDDVSAKLELRLVMLRKQFNEQEESNKDWRETAREYFNFARYAKEDFESDSDEKKRQVLSRVGQNLSLKDGLLLFEPIKYLGPVVKSREDMIAQLAHVGTCLQQMKKAPEEAMISDWCSVVDEVVTLFVSSSQQPNINYRATD